MIFTAGTIAGAAGWYACEHLTGDTPLNSHFAHFTLQVFLSGLSIALAYKTLAPFRVVRLALGFYSGLIIYSAFSDGTVDREGLEIIMSEVAPFALIPLFLGLATIAVKIIIHKYRRKKI